MSDHKRAALPELAQVIRRAILAWHIANDPADQDGEGLDEAIARAVIEAGWVLASDKRDAS